MDEETFIRKITSFFPQGPDVKTGPGDDCAVLDLGLEHLLLAAADQVIEGVHYLKGTSPERIARKLLNRNISDIASMGGTPTHVLLTLAVNPVDEEFLTVFHKALGELASEYSVSVIGGDMAKLPEEGQCFSLTILGKVLPEKLCLRSNAVAGQGLYATGFFGNSFATEHHLDFRPHWKEAQFLAGAYTAAMMDVSDGLLQDAGRFAAASGLSLVLDVEKIPLRQGATLPGALSDGEDYGLLFAMEDSRAEKLFQNWKIPLVPVTRIGAFLPGEPGKVVMTQTLKKELQKTGYDHFR